MRLLKHSLTSVLVRKVEKKKLKALKLGRFAFKSQYHPYRGDISVSDTNPLKL